MLWGFIFRTRGALRMDVVGTNQNGWELGVKHAHGNALQKRRTLRAAGQNTNIDDSITIEGSCSAKAIQFKRKNVTREDRQIGRHGSGNNRDRRGESSRCHTGLSSMAREVEMTGDIRRCIGEDGGGTISKGRNPGGHDGRWTFTRNIRFTAATRAEGENLRGRSGQVRTTTLGAETARPTRREDRGRWRAGVIE